MAHYKRGKSRAQGSCRYPSDTTLRKRFGLKPVRLPEGWWRYPKGTVQMSWDHPFYWNIYGKARRPWRKVFHVKPLRAATRRMERAALMERHDGDDVVWPDKKKPVNYYW